MTQIRGSTETDACYSAILRERPLAQDHDRDVTGGDVLIVGLFGVCSATTAGGTPGPPREPSSQRTLSKAGSRALGPRPRPRGRVHGERGRSPGLFGRSSPVSLPGPPQTWPPPQSPLTKRQLRGAARGSQDLDSPRRCSYGTLLGSRTQLGDTASGGLGCRGGQATQDGAPHSPRPSATAIVWA